MSRVVAIGDGRRLAGYELAGVEVRPTSSPAEVEAAFAGLDGDTGLLVLTADAHAVLAAALAERDRLVWAVLPS